MFLLTWSIVFTIKLGCPNSDTTCSSVFPDFISNYKLNVQNTLYKYLEDNSNNFREQELPEVSSVTINSIINNEYIIENQTYEGYKVNLSWDYVKDLGYDKEGEIILIIIDNNIYIVEKN